jgi:hypothetical protein
LQSADFTVSAKCFGRCHHLLAVILAVIAVRAATARASGCLVCASYAVCAEGQCGGGVWPLAVAYSSDYAWLAAPIHYAVTVVDPEDISGVL